MNIRRHTSTKLITVALLLSMTMLLPNAMADASHLPAGSYSVTVTLADIPPDFPPEIGALIVGTWVTEFTSDGTTVVTQNGDVVVVGRYKSGPSNLVMTDLSGPMACRDARGIATGVYSWSLENNQLHLTTVLDRCFGRMFVLTLRPLQQL